MKRILSILICTILINLIPVSIPAQERYIARAENSILQKLGITKSTSIMSMSSDSPDWRIFTVKDTLIINNLKKAGIYVEPDRKAKISLSDDSLSNKQWGLTGSNGLWRGNFTGAWAISEGDKSVKIGIIDTGSPLKNGIWTHPDLDSSRFTALSFMTQADSDNVVTDFSGHATHIAGVIGATKNNHIGVAGIDQHCQIYTYKVFSRYGSGWYSDIAQAIYRAVHDGCQILSMSFGGAHFSRALEDAIIYANQHNVVCIVAAGNDGSEIGSYPAFFSRFSTNSNYRTGLPNIISVGAIDDFGLVAGYSNRGWFVDVYAPGGIGGYPFANSGNILSTFPNYDCELGKADSVWHYENDTLVVTKRIPAQKKYGYLAGTSMATPFVTGAASLMLAANPSLKPKDIRRILMETADVIMTTNGPVPILNPAEAVRTAKNGGIILAIAEQPIAKDFTLNQNYPNPFNPATTINYSLPQSSFVTLKVYDILGREVASLVNEQKLAGSYQLDFNGSQLASGTYIYRLSAGNFVQVKKMILMK